MNAIYLKSLRNNLIPDFDVQRVAGPDKDSIRVTAYRGCLGNQHIELEANSDEQVLAQVKSLASLPEVLVTIDYHVQETYSFIKIPDRNTSRPSEPTLRPGSILPLSACTPIIQRLKALASSGRDYSQREQELRAMNLKCGYENATEAVANGFHDLYIRLMDKWETEEILRGK